MFNFRILKSSTVRTIEPALRGSFSDAEIAMIADIGSLAHFTCGDEIITEGTPGECVYLISSGTAAVQRKDGVEARLSRGDLVGERSLVTGEPRNATVTVRMPVTAIRFDRHQFARICCELPKMDGLTKDLVESRS